MKTFSFQLVLAMIVLGAGPAMAESDDCADVPESRQAMCWMILSCASIDDGERRQECFQAAYSEFRRDTGRDDPRPPATAPATAATPTPVNPTPAAPVTKDIVSEPVQPSSDRGAADAQPGGIRLETVRETTLHQEFRIPDQFTATVTYQRDLVRNQQLVVLDGTLLFEGDSASEGRLRVDDEVDVVKVTQVFDERYDIIGGGRKVQAERIRCERTDLSKANRRKCTVLGSSE